MSKYKFKYQHAVALEYDNSMNAPQIAVKGETLQADEIVKIAQRYGVPIVEDDNLAPALNELNLDAEIPEELYRAVAVLLDKIDDSIRKK